MLRQALLLAALTLPTLALPAQTAPGSAASAPAAGSNWQHVLALPIGSYIHVNAHTRHSICYLKAVDPESLACTHDTGVGFKELFFQRTEIKNIKLARRHRSAVLGGVIGGGVGALAGGIYGIDNHYFAVRGAFAMIYGFVGLFSGAPTGFLTDFTASTVYRAP